MTRKSTQILGAIALLTLFVACEPPVSDEATVTISGQVLNPDGSPAADQTVELHKAALPLFDNDFLIGVAVASDNAFRQVKTDTDGNFTIELSGTEVNTADQNAAAYFGVTVTRGDDRQMGVATYSFQFSNQKLSEKLPTMQFWDGGEVSVEGEQINFSWSDAPEGTRGDRVHVVVPNVWSDATAEDSYTLSTLALPPTGESQNFQLLALSDKLRHRTSLKPLAAKNPRGAGIQYNQTDNANISGVDCEGKNLFDLNDGVFDGPNAVEQFGQSTTDGARCAIITLPELTEVSDILVHNAGVFNMEASKIEIKVRPTADGEWTSLSTFEGQQTDFDLYYTHVSDLAVEVLELKLEITSDTPNVHFLHLGEITLYSTAP